MDGRMRPFLAGRTSTREREEGNVVLPCRGILYDKMGKKLGILIPPPLQLHV